MIALDCIVMSGDDPNTDRDVFPTRTIISNPKPEKGEYFMETHKLLANFAHRPSKQSFVDAVQNSSSLEIVSREFRDLLSEAFRRGATIKCQLGSCTSWISNVRPNLAARIVDSMKQHPQLATMLQN